MPGTMRTFSIPKQNEDRPEHIDELHRDKQQPERNALVVFQIAGFTGESLTRKAKAVVTYKQDLSSAA